MQLDGTNLLTEPFINQRVFAATPCSNNDWFQSKRKGAKGKASQSKDAIALAEIEQGNRRNTGSRNKSLNTDWAYFSISGLWSGWDRNTGAWKCHWGNWCAWCSSWERVGRVDGSWKQWICHIWQLFRDCPACAGKFYSDAKLIIVHIW